MTTLGANAALAAGSNITGIRLDPYLSHSFLIEIEGLVIGSFSDVTGLQIETEVLTYREGGLNDYAHKLRGPTNYPSNLMLKRGLVDLDTMWRWHQEVLQGTVTRRNGTIYLLDSRGLPGMWWNICEAYPIKWSGPDFQAGANAVAVESVELVHRGIVKPSESRGLSAARGAISGLLQVG